MSTDLYEDGGLYVARMAGPAAEGPDRRRWQVYTPHEPAVLTAPELAGLLVALLASLVAPGSGNAAAALLPKT